MKWGVIKQASTSPGEGGLLSIAVHEGQLYAYSHDRERTGPNRSQDFASRAGKILRITPAGDHPDDNPFGGSPSITTVSPQGLARAEDGPLHSSEFGEATWDELNIVEPGGNYGWQSVEGAGSIQTILTAATMGTS